MTSFWTFVAGLVLGGLIFFPNGIDFGRRNP